MGNRSSGYRYGTEASMAQPQWLFDVQCNEVSYAKTAEMISPFRVTAAAITAA